MVCNRINLIDHCNDRHTNAPDHRCHQLILLIPDKAINHKNHDIRTQGRLFCHTIHYTVNRFWLITMNTRCIKKNNLYIIPSINAGNSVPGRLRLTGRYRELLAQNMIEQCGFSNIRPPHQRHEATTPGISTLLWPIGWLIRHSFSNPNSFRAISATACSAPRRLLLRPSQPLLRVATSTRTTKD